MATIRIPTPLRGYAGGNATVQVSGATVGQLLDGLTSRYPDLRRHLFKDDGALRNFVSIFLNDEDVRHLGGLESSVTDADEVSIVPSIAGGASERSAAPTFGGG